MSHPFESAEYRPVFQEAGTEFNFDNDFYYESLNQQMTPISEVYTPLPPAPPSTHQFLSDYHPNICSYNYGVPIEVYSPQYEYPMTSTPVSASATAKSLREFKKQMPKEKKFNKKKKPSEQVKQATQYLVESKQDQLEEHMASTVQLGLKQIKGDQSEEKPKKKKKKTILRDEDFEWDQAHRRENLSFEKGSIVVKCSDVDSESFGQVIYVVDSYQLLQKYVMEADDIVFGRVFVKTGRFCGWLCDEPWSYYQLNNVYPMDEVTKGRIAIAEFPDKETIRFYCASTRDRHPFYQELLLRFTKTTEMIVKEDPYKLEEGEILSEIQGTSQKKVFGKNGQLSMEEL